MAPRTLIVIGDPAGERRDDGTRPRRDYDALAEHLGADLLDAAILGRRRGRLLDGIAMARTADGRSAAYDNIYCDSEHIGMPLAFLLGRKARRPRLTTIGHYLSPLKKRLMARLLRAQRHIDALIVHSPAQAERARSLGFSAGQVALVPYQVDARFWTPRDAAVGARVASAGQEFRDYHTLMQAVEDQPVEVQIAAGSYWSTRRESYRAADVPPNVSVRRRPYDELRAMYADARFVVVPLHDVDFPAGIITILEAMAMGKAVIVSRTRGQTGTVSGPLMRDGALHAIGEQAWPEATGIYVPPGDSGALRDAIRYLIDHPEVAARMGAAARAHVEASLTLDHFVARVSALIAPAATGERREVYA
ncbi:MAG: glycosyltransferase family 4 protein [Dehalococcoidia bacterium]|nr:glycosyltransferase family 4 protein [Dehalococcoidia bacterium]